MATEWRVVTPGTAWLMFVEAPPVQGAEVPAGPDGVLWPPSAVVNYAADSSGRPFDAACLHLTKLYNGAGPDHLEGEDAEYTHICGLVGLDALLDELSGLRAVLYAGRDAPRPRQSDDSPGDLDRSRAEVARLRELNIRLASVVASMAKTLRSAPISTWPDVADRLAAEAGWQPSIDRHARADGDVEEVGPGARLDRPCGPDD